VRTRAAGAGALAVQPRRDLVPALVDAWLEGSSRAPAPDAGGDCPVCIDPD
jgi:hypothetical protein